MTERPEPFVGNTLAWQWCHQHTAFFPAQAMNDFLSAGVCSEFDSPLQNDLRLFRREFGLVKGGLKTNRYKTEKFLALFVGAMRIEE